MDFKKSGLFSFIVLVLLFISGCVPQFNAEDYAQLSDESKLVVNKYFSGTREVVCGPWEFHQSCGEDSYCASSTGDLDKSRFRRECWNTGGGGGGVPCLSWPDGPCNVPLSPMVNSDDVFYEEGDDFIVVKSKSVMEELSSLFNKYGGVKLAPVRSKSEVGKHIKGNRDLSNVEKKPLRPKPLESRTWYQYKCETDSLCTNTCGDGRLNNLNNAAGGDLGCTSATSFSNGQEEEIYFSSYPNWETNSHETRDRGQCSNLFGQGGSWINDNGLCTGESDGVYDFNLDAPGVWVDGDGDAYAQMINPHYYNIYGEMGYWTNYFFCGSQDSFCYINLGGAAHSEEGTLTMNNGLVLNHFVYVGDHYCQGWADGEVWVACSEGEDECYEGTIDYSPYHNSVLGIPDQEGWFTFNDFETVSADYYGSNEWQDGTVETAYGYGWVDGEGIFQHDCAKGPLDCDAGGDSRVEDCDLGTHHSDAYGNIDWYDSVLDDADDSNSNCDYGDHTEVCAGWKYTGDWGDCTGAIPGTEPAGALCNDGYDNDCDGYGDSFDTECGSCLETQGGGTETEVNGDYQQCGTNEGLCEFGTQYRSCVFGTGVSGDGLWSWESDWGDCGDGALGDYVGEACEDAIDCPSSCADGVDNNCDGLVDGADPLCDADCLYGVDSDQTQACGYDYEVDDVTSEETTDGNWDNGVCITGSQSRSCQVDGTWANWGACSHTGPDGAENSAAGNCDDGYDNDCDGTGDDGESGEDCGECLEGSLFYFTNGDDDICEESWWVGDQCSAGTFTSTCTFDGSVGGYFYPTWVSSPFDGNWEDCEYEDGPVDEICWNGLDDDCDGIPDSEEEVCDSFGIEFLNVPSFSNEQGDESSITLFNDQPFIISSFMETGSPSNINSLAYAKYVGEGGNCGYEGEYGQSVTYDFQCGFIQRGTPGFIFDSIVGQQNSIVSDSNGVYAAYSNWLPDDGNYKFKFAQYCGDGACTGNCGYQSTGETGAPGPLDYTWRCEVASGNNINQMHDPKLIATGSDFYLMYSSYPGNVINVNKRESEGDWTNYALTIASASQNIMWISPEYSADEEKIYFAYATVDSGWAYRIYYSYVDVSSGVVIQDNIDEVSSFSDDGTIIDQSLSQLDTALDDNCNDGDVGICTMHVVNMYKTEDYSFSINYNKANVGQASSDNPTFSEVDVSSLNGYGFGESPSIDIDSMGNAHLISAARISDTPKYAVQLDDGSFEVINYESGSFFTKGHTSLILDSTNRAHLLYLVDHNSLNENIQTDWRVRYASHLV